MNELDHQRQAAFQAGCLNAIAPEYPPVTTEENDAVRALWDTLPGYTCWMSALFMLGNE